MRVPRKTGCQVSVCVPRSQSAGFSSTRGGGGGGFAVSSSASGSRRERFGGGCAASPSGVAIGLGPGLSRVAVSGLRGETWEREESLPRFRLDSTPPLLRSCHVGSGLAVVYSDE
jgi:hypothetical protein